VALTLPVAAGKPVPGAGAAAIEQARRAVPSPSPWSASLRSRPETVTVKTPVTRACGCTVKYS